MFIPRTKSVRLQHNKRVHLLFGIWFTNPRKGTETRKSFCKTSFQLRMDLKKGPKQGRDERMQEDYPTSAVCFCRRRVVLLHSLISALFLSFFKCILNWNEVLQKLFSLVRVWRGRQRTHLGRVNSQMKFHWSPFTGCQPRCTSCIQSGSHYDLRMLVWRVIQLLHWQANNKLVLV